MTEQELQNHHKWALKSLAEVDAILTENEIPYFLIEGSALGAIRHHGIIPWDDDIDIGIFLKDRDRVIDLLSHGISDEFTWVDRTVDASFPRLFSKVLHNGQGCIDIFPLIKTSDNSFLRKIHWVKRKVVNKLYKAKLHYANQYETAGLKDKLKVVLVRVISIFFSMNTILKMVSRIEMKYEKDLHNQYFYNFYGSYSQQRELIMNEWIGKGQHIEFGDNKYPVFSNTHEYLSNLYGDYMTPPPIAERKLHHEETF